MDSIKKIHLVCNAHLDPVWLWEWEEGAAEAMSTFRTAVEFCEEFDSFVFNHNEAILYKWIEEYDPELFRRISKLVNLGKWHIMGGWYLQPDCNMPCGESFVRQILEGGIYFKNKFGVETNTAVNFDPFGHTRGIVQIIKKSGQDFYVFCRPGQQDCPLENDTFIWVGYDGSTILAHRSFGKYLTRRGEAAEKVERWMQENPQGKSGLILWGVGNHGGGPSRQDIKNLNGLISNNGDFEIIHSTPEKYFRDASRDLTGIPRFEKSLNAWAPGCYTSQVRIKQKHRLLENQYFLTEKMLAGASLQGLLRYPAGELKEALHDLLTAQFHDILPGTSIQPVESSSLRLMDHGLEILSRLKARAFFAFARGQKKPRDGVIPIMMYNPHPFPVKGIFECELQLPDKNMSGKISSPRLSSEEGKIPVQLEKELSNVPLDWRKRLIFKAELKPSRMNRFDCQFILLDKKTAEKSKKKNRKIILENSRMQVEINTRTGLMDKYLVDGVDYLEAGSLRLLIAEDDEDPWGMRVQAFDKITGKFKLMPSEQGSAFSGDKNNVESVRLIEDGEVRSVVECVFSYRDSKACVRYKIPKEGTEIEAEFIIYWNEIDKILKLSIPSLLKEGEYIGQTAYGVEKLPQKHKETSAQKWTGLVSKEKGKALTCVNEGIYGSSCNRGEIRLSLLRSPAYAAHPCRGRQTLEGGRFIPRTDQGERIFRIWLNAGEFDERASRIDREALAHNETPLALSYFPGGYGKKTLPSIILSDRVIQMAAFKKSEYDDGYILRFFEPSGKTRRASILIPFLGIKEKIKLSPFEILTLKLDTKTKKLTPGSLMEDSKKLEPV